MGRRRRDESEGGGGSLSVALDKSAAWLDWIDQVPEETRRALSALVLASDAGTHVGLVKMSQTIMAHFVAGDLDITVMQELREWVALLHSQVLAQNPVHTTTTSMMMMQVAQTIKTPPLISKIHDFEEDIEEVQALKPKVLEAR